MCAETPVFLETALVMFVHKVSCFIKHYMKQSITTNACLKSHL